MPFLVLFLLSVSLFAQSDSDRDRKWREDIDYVAAQMTAVNPVLFSRVTREEFDNTVTELRNSISSKSNTEILMGISRVLALAHDGHTDINLFQADTGFRMYPIRVQWFADGLFVISAAQPYLQAIGKRVVSIAGIPIEDVFGQVRPFLSYENDNFARHRSENLLVSPEALRAAGVLKEVGATEYGFEGSDGQRFSLTVSPGSGALLTPHPAEPVNVLSRRNPQLNYWFHYVPESRTLYLQYNSCNESPMLSMKEFVERAMQSMMNRPVDRFIIDLRNNGGGATAVTNQLTNVLDIMIPGGGTPPVGIAITSRLTYSSAAIAAWQFWRRGFVMVGENTGGPAGGGEVQVFQMPNSGLSFRSIARFSPAMSTLYVPVSVPVDFTSQDYFGERDPYFEAALKADGAPMHLPQ